MMPDDPRGYCPWCASFNVGAGYCYLCGHDWEVSKGKCACHQCTHWLEKQFKSEWLAAEAYYEMEVRAQRQGFIFHLGQPSAN